MLKVALTHDVDRIRKTYQYITHNIRNLGKFRFSAIGNSLRPLFSDYEPYWGFDKILGIEAKMGVKSTFFFLNESIPFRITDFKSWKLSLGRYNIKDPKVISIIKYLSANGWEIGLHGSYRSFKDRELLLEEKNVLEEILGSEVLGIRQHYLNLNQDTWKVQKSVGFRYDSSWGYSDRLGYRDDKFRPFHPFNDEFTVFPMAIMDVSCTPVDRILDNLDEIIRLSEEHDAVMVINWHTNYFDEQEFPGFSNTYETIIRRCQKYGAEIKPLIDWYTSLDRIKGFKHNTY